MCSWGREQAVKASTRESLSLVSTMRKPAVKNFSRPSMDCCSCWNVLHVHIIGTHNLEAYKQIHRKLTNAFIQHLDGFTCSLIDVSWVETNFNLYIKKLCLSVSSSDISSSHVRYSWKCFASIVIRRRQAFVVVLFTH